LRPAVGERRQALPCQADRTGAGCGAHSRHPRISRGLVLV